MPDSRLTAHTHTTAWLLHFFTSRLIHNPLILTHSTLNVLNVCVCVCVYVNNVQNEIEPQIRRWGWKEQQKRNQMRGNTRQDDKEMANSAEQMS